MDIPFEKIILYTHTPLNQDRVVFPLDRYQCEIFGSKLPDPLWEWMALRKKADKDKIDVLFCPSYTIPIGYQGKCVVFNHGPAENTTLSFQWWRSKAYERLYRYSAHRANKVLANSYSVSKRLINVYGVSPNKIKVTYLASSNALQPISDKRLIEETRNRYLNGNHSYILFVGKLARRHYIPNLLQAFAELYQENTFPHKLLIVGPDYLNLNIPKLAKNLNVEKSVVHIPYVSHLNLPALYNAAEFFVFPASEAEGFGLPVIEAMACGTPVLTVNQGSLSEFAPGASHLVKNSSVEQLKLGLREMIFNPIMRNELKEKGLERAKSITWKKTADITMDLLWKVANA